MTKATIMIIPIACLIAILGVWGINRLKPNARQEFTSPHEAPEPPNYSDVALNVGTTPFMQESGAQKIGKSVFRVITHVETGNRYIYIEGGGGAVYMQWIAE